ncbi:MAG TPA: hypothetical protein VGD35_18455 [Chitinophaga sp.]
MKKLLLLACAGCFFIPALSAQQLTETAALLFKDVKTKLSVKEKNEIATQLGFISSGNNSMPFALDKDSKEYAFAAAVFPSDMNKDGKEEVFVVFGNSFTSGNTGSSVSLFIKDATGKYAPQLGFPGMAPDVLHTASKGYPDLLIGGPGMEYPVWRWDGKAYNLHRTVNDKGYETLKKMNLADVSKAYTASIH